MWLLYAANLARSFVSRLPTSPLRARSARHAEQLDAFSRELLSAKCRLHTNAAVCDQCVAPRQLDSLGFPSVTAAGYGGDGVPRGRYRLCPTCRKLCSVAEWDSRGGRCKGCAG